MKIADRPYREVVDVATRWLNEPDSLLGHAGSQWSLVSRDDAWHFLAPAVTADHFRRFEEIALEVLAEDDPIYELPLAQQWNARLDKAVPRYSQTLRNGLAETLAIIGARPERLTRVTGIVAQVQRIVRKLLDRQDCSRWASLPEQLPLLAEAACDEFISAVDRDLKRSNSALVKLFGQKGHPLLTSNEHAGLLRALEVLAWNPELFSEVSLILAALDEKTSLEKLGDSPYTSLLEIFRPGLPQTTATVEVRIKVLTNLVKRRPDAGWRLLVGLLPDQPSLMPIKRPSWQKWALEWSRGVTKSAHWQQVDACARLLIEQLGDDLERWKVLIKQLENLPGPAQTEFLMRLRVLAEKTRDQEARRTVSDAIREKASRHRRFTRAELALSREILEELETVRSRFEPEDPVRKNAWVFGPRWQVLETFEGREEQVDAHRRAALREILDNSGWEGIERLIQEAPMPEEVGAELVKIDSAEIEARILPDYLATDGEKAARFARGYIRVRFQGERWDWVERLEMVKWSAEEVARLLVDLPFERRTWEFAAAKGNEVATSYWRNARPFTPGLNVDEARYAVARLLEHQRPSGAIHVLQMAIQEKLALAPSLLMEVLQTWLEPEAGDRETGLTQGVTHGIQILFQELQRRVVQNDPNVDLDRLAKLESNYLALLDGHPVYPVTLRAKLRDDPVFFVDVLALAFPSEKDLAEGVKEFSEQEKQRIKNAYRLLRSWQDVPGKRDDHTVDENALRDWLHKARSLAKERGLLKFCDSQIGEVFAYASGEEEDSWPCISVRDALEDTDSEEVFNGFRFGVYNKERGVQGRELVKKYRKFADASKIEWPRTAQALRDVAKSYEEEARREDERASQDD